MKTYNLILLLVSLNLFFVQTAEAGRRNNNNNSGSSSMPEESSGSSGGSPGGSSGEASSNWQEPPVSSPLANCYAEAKNFFSLRVCQSELHACLQRGHSPLQCMALSR